MVPNKPVLQLTIEELKEMIEADIERIKKDISDGKVSNKYQAQSYVKKLQEFLKLRYFQGKVYKKAKEILGNLKFVNTSSEETISQNQKKISDIKKLKKLKGQIGFFDEYSLTDEEIKRALQEPNEFIDELREKNVQLEKDAKLARFCLYYLMDRKGLFDSLRR